MAAGGAGGVAAWGDQAVIQLSTDRAAGFHQLVGPYSRFGWSHPGPLWFYLLAGPYRALGGGTRGLVAAAVLVSGLFALAVVALAGWLGGRATGRWAAALVAVELAALGPAALARVWNPVAVVVPTAALLVACAGVATGRWWALPWAVGLGSFLVQTDVSTGLAVAAVGGAAVVAGGVGSWRRSGRDAWRGAWRAVAVAAGVGAALWLPPLVQQLTGTPGNLGTVAGFFTTGHPGHPVGAGAAAAAGALWPPLRGRTGAGGPSGVGAWAVVGAALAWAAVAAGAGFAGRGGPGETRSAGPGRVSGEGRAASRLGGGLAALTGVVLVAGVVSATRAVGPLFPYLTLWLSACVVGLLLATLLVVARGRAAVVATGAAALACAALMVVATVARPPSPAGGRDVASLWAAVRTELPAPGRGAVRVDVATADRWPWAAGLLVELTHHDYRAVADRPWLFLFGSQFAPSRPPATTVAVWRPGGPTRRPPGRLAARAGDTAVVVTAGGGGAGAGP